MPKSKRRYRRALKSSRNILKNASPKEAPIDFKKFMVDVAMAVLIKSTATVIFHALASSSSVLWV